MRDQPTHLRTVQTLELRDRLLKIPEVAEALGLGLTKTWELINRCEIRSITIGRCRRVKLSDLYDYIQRQEAGK